MKYIKEYNCWCGLGISDAIIIGNLIIEIPKDLKKIKLMFLDMFKKEKTHIKYCFLKTIIKFIHLNKVKD